MESTDKPADPEAHTKGDAPPPPQPLGHFFVVDVVLRALLFAAAVVAIVVLATGNQTVLVPNPNAPTGMAPHQAKFKYSPAFRYYVAALSAAGLYSINTILVSIINMSKPRCSKKVLLHFAFGDVLMLGLVASATGAAGAIGYTGLKGNKHTQWDEVCGTFDKFCIHVGSSLAVSLFASVVLVLLCFLSISSLHKRIRD